VRNVVYSRNRYRGAGTVYGAICEACDTILIWTWDKREAKAVGREHEREHRRQGV